MSLEVLQQLAFDDQKKKENLVRAGTIRERKTIVVKPESDPQEVLDRLELDLSAYDRSILLMGGARLEPAFFRLISNFLINTFVNLQLKEKSIFFTGGTARGVIRIPSEARIKMLMLGDNLTVLGIAPKIFMASWETKATPERKSTPADALTHLVLIDDVKSHDNWSCPLFVDLANQINCVGLLINGGPITAKEVALSLNAGNKIVVLKGSGRFADQLASFVELAKEKRLKEESSEQPLPLEFLPEHFVQLVDDLDSILSQVVVLDIGQLADLGKKEFNFKTQQLVDLLRTSL